MGSYDFIGYFISLYLYFFYMYFIFNYYFIFISFFACLTLPVLYPLNNVLRCLATCYTSFSSLDFCCGHCPNSFSPSLFIDKLSQYMCQFFVVFIVSEWFR